MKNSDRSKRMGSGFLSCIVTALFLVISATAYADDIKDSINEALEYYSNGELTDAIESLEYASQLIKQHKAKEMEAFLPAPLPGWTAQKTQSKAGGGMFGPGVSAESRYIKAKASVTVQIFSDSPLMQGAMMMISNPMYATADGGKLEKIGRQKAIVKYDPGSKRGDIKMVVANRFFIQIEGRDMSEDDLKGYAKGIDFKKLARMQ